MKLHEIEIGGRYTYYDYDESRHLRHYPALVEKKNKKSVVVRIFDALSPDGKRERVKPSELSALQMEAFPE